MSSLNKVKVYIVSLKDSLDRRSLISEQLKALSLNYTLFDAINPKENKDFLSYYDECKAIEINGRNLTLGEIGCTLSHQFIYQDIMKEEKDFFLILEDDALINIDLKCLLERLNEIKESWDVIILGYSKVSEVYYKKLNKFNPIGPAIFDFKEYRIGSVLKNSTCGTVGYILNKAGAEKLYNQEIKAVSLADNWPYFEKALGLKIYHSRPFLVFEDFQSFESSIESDRVLLSKKNREGFIKEFFKYLRGYVRYCILFLFKR